MPKKKFSETRVGKFLKGIAPKILGIIGDVVTFYGVASGSFLPVLILGVFGSNENTEVDGTSATNILALY